MQVIRLVPTRKEALSPGWRQSVLNATFTSWSTLHSLRYQYHGRCRGVVAVREEMHDLGTYRGDQGLAESAEDPVRHGHWLTMFSACYHTWIEFRCGDHRSLLGALYRLIETESSKHLSCGRFLLATLSFDKVEQVTSRYSQAMMWRQGHCEMTLGRSVRFLL